MATIVQIPRLPRTLIIKVTPAYAPKVTASHVNTPDVVSPGMVAPLLSFLALS